MSRDIQDVAMLKRLRDQRKVQDQVAKIHSNARLLKEIAFYPAHDVRKETPEYTRAHKHLTEELDLPCIVCGVKHSTLGDPKENRYSAKAMETHHHVIEWALANAIDVDKFNKAILPNLRHRHQDRNEYHSPFTQKQVADWVDHHEDNLWVLCDVHHRAKYLGIHEITFPIWGPMDLLRPDFDQYVDQQIKQLADETKAAKAAAKVAAKTPAAAKGKPMAPAAAKGKPVAAAPAAPTAAAVAKTGKPVAIAKAAAPNGKTNGKHAAPIVKPNGKPAAPNKAKPAAKPAKTRPAARA